ncbi:hypothetical protein GCM10010321_76150 [Streptomyces chartreusis]|nr:hypothetical protein CP983_26725 [Streptomyces chartreusis]GGX48140.1 hypothetical protein GCM10010321_76150 [Streptomyces chartreusis]
MVSMFVRIDRGPPRTEEWYGAAHIADVLSGNRPGRHECPRRRDVLAGRRAGAPEGARGTARPATTDPQPPDGP